MCGVWTTYTQGLEQQMCWLGSLLLQVGCIMDRVPGDGECV